MGPRAQIGAELRALRLAAGLSMVEASRRAEVSRMTLHRWETGTVEPEIAGLDRLLKRLGTDERTRARLLSEVSPTPALPELTNGPLGSPVHLGQALRALRAWRGIGQGALAQATGTTQATIARWESGAFRPGDEALERLLAALRASPADAAWARLLANEEPLALGSPLDAKAWLEANAPTATAPREVEYLAFEREVWKRATRDARWEPVLVQTMANRAWAHGFAVNIMTVASRTAASGALALARADSLWDEAFPALEVLASDFLDPVRHERMHAAAYARVRSALARESLLYQWAHNPVDLASGQGLVRRMRELRAVDPQHEDHVCLFEGDHRLRFGDPEGAIERYEASAFIREADYGIAELRLHQCLRAMHRAGQRPRPDLVAAAQQAHAGRDRFRGFWGDWCHTAREIGVDP